MDKIYCGGVCFHPTVSISNSGQGAWDQGCGLEGFKGA